MITGVEIWELEDGWKEIGKLHELLCKIVMGMPSTAANGVCVSELGKINMKERVLENVLKYWQRLWEMDEISLLGDALIQQSLKRRNKWMNKTKQELEILGAGGIWINGGQNNTSLEKNTPWSIPTFQRFFHATSHGSFLH
jgi:hypothetical protein